MSYIRNIINVAIKVHFRDVLSSRLDGASAQIPLPLRLVFLAEFGNDGLLLLGSKGALESFEGITEDFIPNGWVSNL